MIRRRRFFPFFPFVKPFPLRDIKTLATVAQRRHLYISTHDHPKLFQPSLS